MIDVKSAETIVLKDLPFVKTKTLSLLASFGQILKENLRADRDSPAADKSIVDGIAIAFSAYKKNITVFKIQAVQPAGKKALKLNSEMECIEIMTGALLPVGCDCVIPFERISIKNKTAVLSPDLKINRFDNIRKKGSDHRKGTLLLHKNNILDPSSIAIAASIGKFKLKVAEKIKIAILSTGDELVDVDHKNIKPFELRQSNAYFLRSLFDGFSLFRSTVFHLKDNKGSMKVKIRRILKEFDVLVVSGGVSMGKFDFVPEVLKELGVKVRFHKVAQRPGKPFWFGTKGKIVVYALPGNPLSTAVCAYRYVIPALKKSLGLQLSNEFAAIDEDFDTRTDLTCFVPVKIASKEDGKLVVSPIKTGGSGDLASLAEAKGFFEFSSNTRMFKKGVVGKLFRY